MFTKMLDLCIMPRCIKNEFRLFFDLGPTTCLVRLFDTWSLGLFIPAWIGECDIDE